MGPSGTVYYVPCKTSFWLWKLLISGTCLIGLVYFGVLPSIGVNNQEVSLRNYIYRLKKDVDKVQSDVTEIKHYRDESKEKLDNIESILKSIYKDSCSFNTTVKSKETCEKNSFDPVQPLKNEEVNKLIDEALDRYSQDRTGKVDFALESAGGRIISTPNTTSYEMETDTVSIFGFPISWIFRRNERALIQPNTNPGECWAFKGCNGTAIVQLLGRVFLNGVTLEHIPKNLSPVGHIRSAPKDFSIYGMERSTDSNPKLLGRFTYLQHGPPLQHFSIQNQLSSFRYIQFKVTTNHGNSDYTCVYRLRVHGKLDNQSIQFSN